MNKEKIEKAKKILLKEDRFYDDETEIKATKVLLKYIQELEQKESILDKVTDKLKEKIEIVEMVIDLCNADGRIAKYKIEQQKEEKKDLQEILNIIEGGINNGK